MKKAILFLFFSILLIKLLLIPLVNVPLGYSDSPAYFEQAKSLDLPLLKERETIKVYKNE